MVLTVKKLQRGSNFKLLCSMNASPVLEKFSSFDETSEIINLKGLAGVYLQIIGEKSSYQLWVKMKKNENAMTRTVSLNIIYGALENEFFCCDNWVNTLIVRDVLYDSVTDCNGHENCFSTPITVTWQMQMTIHAEMPAVPFLNNVMYDDMDYTDFELKTADGTVAVHKNVLAWHSNMFKKMMRGEWKDTKEAFIEGVTLETLQDLKNYLYLGTLPDDYVRLEPLMIIGVRYCIDNLKAHCIPKIIKCLNPANFDDIVNLAMLKNIPELIKALIFEVPDDLLDEIHQLKNN